MGFYRNKNVFVIARLLRYGDSTPYWYASVRRRVGGWERGTVINRKKKNRFSRVVVTRLFRPPEPRTIQRAQTTCAYRIRVVSACRSHTTRISNSMGSPFHLPPRYERNDEKLRNIVRPSPVDGGGDVSSALCFLLCAVVVYTVSLSSDNHWPHPGSFEKFCCPRRVVGFTQHKTRNGMEIF